MVGTCQCFNLLFIDSVLCSVFIYDMYKKKLETNISTVVYRHSRFLAADIGNSRRNSF